MSSRKTTTLSLTGSIYRQGSQTLSYCLESPSGVRGMTTSRISSSSIMPDMEPGHIRAVRWAGLSTIKLSERNSSPIDPNLDTATVISIMRPTRSSFGPAARPSSYESDSDTLFLLDCCYASSGSKMAPKGFSETIAASAFEGISPPPGPHSFTTALIKVLRERASADQTFSVASLHQGIVEHLASLPLDQVAPDGMRLLSSEDLVRARPGKSPPFEWRRTPIHCIHGSQNLGYSILLGPLRAPMPMPDFILLNPPTPKVTATGMRMDINLQLPISNHDALSARRWLRSIPFPFSSISIQLLEPSGSEPRVCEELHLEEIPGEIIPPSSHQRWSCRQIERSSAKSAPPPGYKSFLPASKGYQQTSPFTT